MADDDQRLVQALALTLKRAGMLTESVQDGASAYHRLVSSGSRIDAAVLDVQMPSMSGVEIVQKLRSNGHTTPLLLLSHRTSESDTVLGLTTGADDYLPKPFRPRELVARVERLIRQPRDGAESPADTVSWGSAVFDFRTYTVSGVERSVTISRTEAELFRALLEDAGAVVTRERLLVAGWGSTNEANLRSLYEHLRRMRMLLSEAGVSGSMRSIRGVGYRLDLD